MNYTPYGAYKDSGIKTLGRIPSHWIPKRLKQMARIKNGQDYKHIETSSENGYPVIGSGGKFAYASEFIYEGESVLLGRKGTVDKPLYINAAFWTVDTMFYTQVLKGSCARYLYYCAITIPFSYYSTNTALPSMTQEDLGGNYFAAPEHDEQQTIASFLDHETAKIDTLIAKQQQLIRLLKEKRQVVISHAVTKGLNPDAPMKDSGIEWLGEVPEHWKVSPFKFQTMEMQTGPFGSQLHAEDYVENETPLINPAHIVNGQITPNTSCTVDKDTQERLFRHKLEKGDLILARRGELGRCAVVRAEHEGWLCGTGSLKTTLYKTMRPDYAYMLISSEGVKVELSLESKGSTMENLNTETLGKIRLPVPPTTEQDEILRFVSEINDKYDDLQGLAEKQISLLHERRTALISAAVTGKIDIRNWKPEKGSASRF